MFNSRRRQCIGSLKTMLLGISVIGTVLFLMVKKQLELNAKIDSMVKGVVILKEEQEKINEIHQQFSMDVNITRQSMDAQLKQVEVLERQSRRYNLWFFGVGEVEGENCEAVLYEIIEKKIGISLGPKDIESAYRVGDGEKPRKILAKFSRFKDKVKILYRKKMMHGNIKIEDDLTEAQLIDKHNLENFAKEAESLGKTVKWSGKQLFVDGSEIKPENLPKR